MKAETLDPGSFEVTFVTIVDLMGSLLTSDNVTSVRCVVNERVTMRTLFHSMFPLVISELSKVTGNKITGITSMLTGDFIIHTVVALITGVSITRRNWVNTFIVRQDHLFQDRQRFFQILFLADGFGAVVCFTDPSLVIQDNMNFPFLMSDSLVRKRKSTFVSLSLFSAALQPITPW